MNKISTLILFTALSASTAAASEQTMSVVVKPADGQQAMSAQMQAKTAVVWVEIDNLGKVESYGEIMPIGSTAADALEMRHKTTRGLICTTMNGILTVDGIGNFQRGDYWAVSVNGDYAHTNANTVLKSGDLVQWRRIKV